MLDKEMTMLKRLSKQNGVLSDSVNQLVDLLHEECDRLGKQGKHSEGLEIIKKIGKILDNITK